MPTKDPKTGEELTSPKEQEAALFLHILESGVYVAPGAFYHAKEYGFFRLTFSVEQDIMAVGLDRLKMAIDSGSDRAGLPAEKQEAVNPQEVEDMAASFTTASLAEELAHEVPCHC